MRSKIIIFYSFIDVMCERIQRWTVRISCSFNIRLCSNIFYSHWFANLQIGSTQNFFDLQKFYSGWTTWGGGVGLLHEVSWSNCWNHHIINSYGIFCSGCLSNCSWIGGRVYLPNWSSNLNRIHFLVKRFTGIYKLISDPEILSIMHPVVLRFTWSHHKFIWFRVFC